LRKLQEIEIRQEHQTLTSEQSEINDLLQSPVKQRSRLKVDIKAIEKRFSKNTALGARRTTLAEAPQVAIVPIEAIIEREDVTVICSEKGWIRAIKGHQISSSDLKYKDGDEGRYVIPAQTTDKLVIVATNGRFYTIGIDKLSRGRGHGEPLRLLIDLDQTEEVIEMMVVKILAKPQETIIPTHYLLAATDGRGFRVSSHDILAQTRSGRQVMLLNGSVKAKLCLAIPENSSDHLIAVIGENRKLVIFSLNEVPILTRGRGVILQKYRQGGLCDVKILGKEEGLTWQRSGKLFKEIDLRLWQARRGAVGRLAPIGFPRNNKFKE